MFVTFMTIEDQEVHINTAHIVAIVGDDAAEDVAILTTAQVFYNVKQDPAKPVRAFITGQVRPNKGWSAGQA